MAAKSNGATQPPLVEVEHLVKHFAVRRGFFGRRVGAVKAVDDISFAVAPGETLALVGESGCGKSTTGRLVLRLIEATSGAVRFAGRNIFSAMPNLSCENKPIPLNENAKVQAQQDCSRRRQEADL